MAIQQPSSISQAIGLAKLVESKIKDSKPKPNRPFCIILLLLNFHPHPFPSYNP